MEMTFELNSLISNIITIAVEVILIAISFVLLNGIFKRIFSGVIAAPALARWQGIAKKAQSNLRFLLAVLATLLIIAAIGANLYLMYLGKNLPEYTL